MNKRILGLLCCLVLTLTLFLTQPSQFSTPPRPPTASGENAVPVKAKQTRNSEQLPESKQDLNPEIDPEQNSNTSAKTPVLHKQSKPRQKLESQHVVFRFFDDKGIVRTPVKIRVYRKKPAKLGYFEPWKNSDLRLSNLKDLKQVTFFSEKHQLYYIKAYELQSFQKSKLPYTVTLTRRPTIRVEHMSGVNTVRCKYSFELELNDITYDTSGFKIAMASCNDLHGYKVAEYRHLPGSSTPLKTLEKEISTRDPISVNLLLPGNWLIAVLSMVHMYHKTRGEHQALKRRYVRFNQSGSKFEVFKFTPVSSVRAHFLLDGQDLTNCRVIISGRDLSNKGAPFKRLGKTRTNKNGVLFIPAILSEEIQITVGSFNPLSVYSQILRLEPNQKYDLGTIEMPTQTISGRVIGPDGEGVPNISLTLNSTPKLIREVTLKTKADGSYEVRLPKFQTLRIRVNKMSIPRSLRIDSPILITRKSGQLQDIQLSKRPQQQ